MKKIQVLVGLGLLVNEENKILLTLRNDPKNAQTHKKWEIPGGGVEFGETITQTVKREMKEEVGVDVKILDHSPIIESNVWKYPDNHVHVTLICYLCRTNDTPHPSNREILDTKWVDENDIKKLSYLPKCDILVKKAITQIKNKSGK